MNRFIVKLFFILILFISENSIAQYSSQNNFYISMGTSVSSYLGGYFGNAYQLRVLSDSYDSYSYNSSYSYNTGYSYNNYTLWSPLSISFAMGYKLHENISMELGSTFLFHLNGRLDPEFKSGTIGSSDYQDRNSSSTLFAIPVSATLNLHSSDQNGEGFFIKGGPAFQYTSEKYDRIREFYSYNNFNSYSHYSYLGTISKSRWLAGFTTGIGVQFNLSDEVSNFTELEYSYFKIHGDNSTALAIDRAKEAQLFALTTKVYFNF